MSDLLYREDPEFEIVKNPKEHNTVVTSIKHARTDSQNTLNPVWIDEDEAGKIKVENTLSQPTILDIKARLNRKRKLGLSGSPELGNCDVEKLYEVLRVDDDCFTGSEIRMRRLHDANRERLSCGSLTSVEFSHSYHIFMTTCVDTTMALFNFGKSDCPLLVDCVFEKFPVSSAKFFSAGEKIILTGKKSYFKVYDINSGKETHPNVPLGIHCKEQVNNVQVSPKDNIAALSAPNRVYLVDLRTLEKIATARVSGSVTSHCFSHKGELLNTFSADGSVFVFDLRHNARPMYRWTDYSCAGGSSFAISDDSKYIACGSETGYVNIYMWAAVMNEGTRTPKPLKSVGNLATGVDQLLFHPSGQVLYMASSLEPAAARLFDLDSQRVYSNFPACMGELGVPTSVGFSLNGGYLAVGQESGRAALYQFDWKKAKY
uniref:WD_REPEATS_REGION domain-containing protein n=2 Tax=Mesocestoides corti TaxID=53468 RepID=A0A5K3FB43_MESCO